MLSISTSSFCHWVFFSLYRFGAAHSTHNVCHAFRSSVFILMRYHKNVVPEYHLIASLASLDAAEH